MRRRIIAGAIVAVTLTAGGVAYAQNQPSDPTIAVTKAAATGAASPAAAGGKAALLKGAIHGDLVVRGKDGSTSNVTFDRGKVSSVSESQVTIERPDGVSVSKDISAQTVFNGTPREQLTSGTPVIVVSEGQAATHVVSKGARAQAAGKACATDPAGDSAADGKGLKARIKDRICQRVEKRQERREKRQQRRAGNGPEGAAGGGASAGQPSAGQPAAGPSSFADDGFETIVS
jgi:hypothetical protein